MSPIKQAFACGALVLGSFLINVSTYGAVQVQLQISGEKVSVIGRKGCQASAEVSVILPTEVTNKEKDYRALVKNIKGSETKGSSDCDASVTDKKRLDIDFDVSQPTIKIKDVLIPKSACSANGGSGNRVLCIYPDEGGDLLAYAHFKFDTVTANFEAFEAINAINGSISFKVKYSGPKVRFKICYGEDGVVNTNVKDTDCSSPWESKEFDSADIKLPNLKNGTKYYFKVQLLDSRNGPSEWSELSDATPIKVASPIESYDGHGGNLEFSCQQSNAASLWIFVLTLIFLCTLRLRKTPPALYALLFIAFFVILPSEHSYADETQVSFSFLGAMYRPDLDSEIGPSGNAIFPFYHCFFRRKTADKNGPINPLMGVEVDWHVWDGFGSLQLGLGMSYTFARGRAVGVDNAGNPNCNDRKDNAKVTLHMYQLRPQLTYVFNPYMEYVPLVPYVRAGLIGHGYMFFLDDKNEPSATKAGITHKPNGFRFGWQAAIGLMLYLNFLEPGAVTTARGEGTYWNAFLKAELSYTKIDTFGQKGYQFSAKDVMGSSLPLMWTFGIGFEI